MIDVYGATEHSDTTHASHAYELLPTTAEAHRLQASNAFRSQHRLKRQKDNRTQSQNLIQTITYFHVVERVCGMKISTRGRGCFPDFAGNACGNLSQPTFKGREFGIDRQIRAHLGGFVETEVFAS